jgi:hypothetical protein
VTKYRTITLAVRRGCARGAEEILPFIIYLHHRRWLEAAMLGKRPPSTPATIALYRTLPLPDLSERLAEESERAKLLDDKTAKMTLAFTLALGVLGAAATLAKNLGSSSAMNYIQAGIVISTGYILIGGWLALAGYRTLPRFGYGTMFRVDIMKALDPKESYVDGLLRQETANTIRQIRNEAAYQCLRNGFVAFAVVLVVYVFAVRTGSTSKEVRAFRPSRAEATRI